jgi:hypothetical protein
MTSLRCRTDSSARHFTPNSALAGGLPLASPIVLPITSLSISCSTWQIWINRQTRARKYLSWSDSSSFSPRGMALPVRRTAALRRDICLTPAGAWL